MTPHTLHTYPDLVTADGRAVAVGHLPGGLA